MTLIMVGSLIEIALGPMRTAVPHLRCHLRTCLSGCHCEFKNALQASVNFAITGPGKARNGEKRNSQATLMVTSPTRIATTCVSLKAAILMLAAKQGTQQQELANIEGLQLGMIPSYAAASAGFAHGRCTTLPFCEEMFFA